MVEHHIGDRRCGDQGGRMTKDRVRVSERWLALREPADAAAHARDLIERLALEHPGSGRWLIHDLGCGTGAMGRWLAPLLPRPQHWVLHDRDADLLEIAKAERPGPAAAGAAITASALLDMLTEDELSALVTACAGAGCPVLLTLSVVGRVSLAPPDPLDRRVAAAVDGHQCRDTERGRLLGPDAVAAAVEQFEWLGDEVHTRASPWRLGSSQADLALEWFTGWVRAAGEQEIGLATDAYVRRRLAQLAAGRLAVTVEHADLLALPRP